jgi:hypothetical protein
LISEMLWRYPMETDSFSVLIVTRVIIVIIDAANILHHACKMEITEIKVEIVAIG